MPPSEPMREMHREEVEMLLQMRQEKDLFFKHHPKSPLSREIKGEFKGLNYYPVNPSYRFLCRLDNNPKHEIFKMMTSTGKPRDYLKVGKIRFTLDSKEQILQVYKVIDEPPNAEKRKILFVPFRDVTCGEESYGAGRYLEIEELEDGLFMLDFNMAYNPFCAYNENYCCPVTPKENWLEVRIEAGEKKFNNSI